MCQSRNPTSKVGQLSQALMVRLDTPSSTDEPDLYAHSMLEPLNNYFVPRDRNQT